MPTARKGFGIYLPPDAAWLWRQHQSRRPATDLVAEWVRLALIRVEVGEHWLNGQTYLLDRCRATGTKKYTRIDVKLPVALIEKLQTLEPTIQPKYILQALLLYVLTAQRSADALSGVS